MHDDVTNSMINRKQDLYLTYHFLIINLGTELSHD